ncbi:MAG: hypothetical protein HY860_05390 [Chlamydiales bacterium]|nr:hypothetical protein [Chlamydiales bacterium]
MGFHLLLIDQIKQDIQQFCDLTGITTPSDNKCLSAISIFEKSHDNFDAIIRLYEDVKQKRNVLYIEEILKESFPEKDYAYFDLPLWSYPKIYQTLPIGKRREDSAHLFTVKKDFLHVPTLKSVLLKRAILPLFANVKLKQIHTVHLLTWVIPDGFGDFYTQMYVAKLIKEHFYNIHVKLLSIFHEQKQIAYHQDLLPYEKIIYRNDEELHRLHMDKRFLQSLSCDLLLQLPTYYPETPHLLAKINIKKYEQIGEYGFLNHAPYQPKSGGQSLGLHFLEQGVFIKQRVVKDPFQLEDSQLTDLFKGKKGNALKEHLSSIRLYLAYLKTEAGHYVFIHGLLKHLEKDTKNIVIIVADLICLMRLIDRDLGKDFALLRSYGIQSLKVHAGPICWEKEIQTNGKKLLIYQQNEIGQQDFYKLMQLSGNPVPCRGNQSFSECLSLDKMFFIDAPSHATYFLQDLRDIAQHIFPSYHHLHAYLLLIEKVKVAKQVEWHKLGEELGILLTTSLNKELLEFSTFIKTHYNADDFFLLLIKKQLLFIEHPLLEGSLESYIESFCHGKLSFMETMQYIKTKLEKFY